MSKLLLVTYDDNYGDEFDLYGFKIMTQEDFDEMIVTAEKAIDDNPDREYYFGTNEAMQYSSVDEYRNAFSVKEITFEEAQLITKLFDLSEINGKIYGQFGHFFELEPDDDDWDFDGDEEDEDE